MRRARQRREPLCDEGVEAAEAQLGRNHHEREEQDQRARVDRATRLIETHVAERDEDDRPDQGDAGAVELEKGSPPRIIPRYTTAKTMMTVVVTR